MRGYRATIRKHQTPVAARASGSLSLSVPGRSKSRCKKFRNCQCSIQSDRIGERRECQYQRRHCCSPSCFASVNCLNNPTPIHAPVSSSTVITKPSHIQSQLAGDRFTRGPRTAEPYQPVPAFLPKIDPWKTQLALEINLMGKQQAY